MFLSLSHVQDGKSNQRSTHPHVQVCQKDKTTLSFSAQPQASVLFIFGPRAACAVTPLSPFPIVDGLLLGFFLPSFPFLLGLQSVEGLSQFRTD